jgi:hypothetical protein
MANGGHLCKRPFANTLCNWTNVLALGLLSGRPWAPEILPSTWEVPEMPSFLALLTFLLAAGVHVERASVPGPERHQARCCASVPEDREWLGACRNQ